MPDLRFYISAIHKDSSVAAGDCQLWYNAGMGIAAWFAQNWFSFFSVLGIVAALWFTAISLQSQTKAQQVANLLTITSNHREIWKEYFHNPALARVLDPSANLASRPLTHSEEMFVNLVILQFGSVYYATTRDLVIEMDGIKRDVSQFLSLPVPRAVWEKWKVVQNADVVAFIDGSLNSK